MNKSVLVLLISFSTLCLIGQQNSWTKLILGTWELKKMIKDDSHGFTLLGEEGDKKDESIPTIVIKFDQKGKFEILKSTPSKGKYKFKSDSIFQVGNRNYKILELADTILKMEVAGETLFKPDILIFTKLGSQNE